MYNLLTSGILVLLSTIECISFPETKQTKSVNRSTTESYGKTTVPSIWPKFHEQKTADGYIVT